MDDDVGNGHHGDGDDAEIPLREWIGGAVLSVDDFAIASARPLFDDLQPAATGAGADPKTSVVTSDRFLLPALKVAQSLAEQIKEAQQSVEKKSADWTAHPYLPVPGEGWAEHATVRLRLVGEIGNGDRGKRETLAFSSDKEVIALPGAAETRENSSSLRKEALSENGDGNNRNGAGNTWHEQRGHLSVRGARFLAPPSNGNNNTDPGASTREVLRIYSLGLVFYELFSGGEIPPRQRRLSRTCDPLLLSETNGNGTEPSDIYEPLPFDQQIDPVDMAKRLSLLDDVETEFLGSTGGRIALEDHGGHMSKKKATNSGGEISLISTEPLKALGLPWSLCNLVANMLDCAHGDFRGDESYGKIADVCSDLQLMLDNPGTYLYDLDLPKIATDGLQLKYIVFGREAEFAKLQKAYARAISGEIGLAIISGMSGTGKSVLAHRFGGFVTSQKGTFLSAKFDQLQQTTPFSSIAAAFNQYCDMLLRERESTHAKMVTAQLKLTLEKEAHHLVKVIPSLKAALGLDDIPHEMNQGCVNAQNRLLYLLCRFMEVIAAYPEAPVTLFLDDLQWADPRSIEVIRQLLLTSGSFNKTSHFFFLGCMREEEVDEDHPFVTMLSDVRKFEVQVTKINLMCIERVSVNKLVSNVLCLPPRLTRPLSELIWHKTNGNALFFSQFMMAIFRDGLLWPSLRRRRWVWDEEKIRSKQIPEDVAKFMEGNIRKMPKEVQFALCTLSCFGASTSVRLIEILGRQLQMPLIDPLEIAVAEGILDKINGSYKFGHDRLQEAAYNMTKPEERCLFHFKYGIALSCNIDYSDSEILFAAVDQLNRGGPAAVESSEQFALIAKLNFFAGKRAMDMSDFSSAYSYMDHGISFLRKRHWEDHYDISLGLFTNAAKCALFTGELVALKYLCSSVTSKAKFFEDKLETLCIMVGALALNEPPKAIEHCITVLSRLDEQFRDSYAEDDIKLAMAETKAMTQGFTDQGLLEYRRMQDPSKIAAMKLLARLELLTQMARPSWQPIVTMKVVQLSIKHGLAPGSALGFTYFGALIARLGNIHEGYRYVKIGRKLIEAGGMYDEVAGEMISIGTNVMCFVEPLQSAIDCFLQGHAAAMSSGDISNALMNRLFYALCSFWAGTDLNVVRERFATSRRMMQKQNSLTWLAHLTPVERSMLALIGGADENLLPGELCLVGTSHASMVIAFQKLYLSFMFREFDPMKTYAEEYFSFDVTSWSLLYLHVSQTFYGGLAAWAIFRKWKDPIWSDRGRKAKFAMKSWAESCEWNFQSKLLLLDAEEASCYNEMDRAKALYEESINAARSHRFQNEDALACELAGYHFTEVGENDVSMEYFLQAHEKYYNWGALAKANAVYEFAMSSLDAA